ncbi:hypothetical protein H0H92_012164 [Tricholoma furcatifolium]|nr:hypothetical protein H0H92_012164 [Tricholoma furcatifolium]
MWESVNPDSKWAPYLAILPDQFDTPMFWTESDLKELDGTSVVEKLGREDAEQSYREKLLPAVQSRQDLFPPALAEHYSLANYHLMGSRILSRSFNVEKWDSGEEEEEETTIPTNSRDHEMDVDTPDGPTGTHENGESHGEAEEEEEEEDSSDTAMVPMADMLNARYGSENAKLFDDENELRMVSTKPIKAGEQIVMILSLPVSSTDLVSYQWNTYGDLPNAELLRRYGHVDLLPLPQGGVGNPGDVVEIRGDLTLPAILRKDASLSEDLLRERIDWWLEEGGDDVFVLEAGQELPELLISLVRLLLLNQDEWETVKTKSKPPKPKIDAHVLGIVQEVVETRLKAYPTTLQESNLGRLQEDEGQLVSPISKNKKHAILVRMGEKRILNDSLAVIRGLQSKHSSTDNKKRKAGDGEGSKPTKRSRK